MLNLDKKRDKYIRRLNIYARYYGVDPSKINVPWLQESREQTRDRYEQIPGCIRLAWDLFGEEIVEII